MTTAILCVTTAGFAQERQITSSPRAHNLDNNDNFSPDGRFLVYDTRETVGPGIENGQSIEKVEIETGKETVLYRPKAIVSGDRPAPGVAAVSWSPVADEVAFIHGPLVEELDWRGPYGKPNRDGASVPGDGSGTLRWLDKRDIATGRDTTPGAHRGGTHRHEYTLDGKRIGFTYDDFLLPQYERTVGYMVPHPKAPAPASHYFALLVPVVPAGTAKPGEIERAWGDSWIGREGKMRAFIGKVRNDDGKTYEQSLFVIDIPDEVDITTADAGSATRYPSPPKGIQIRRLTHTAADGTVRGTVEGDRIAYYAMAQDGTKQIFVIASDGSDQNPDKAPVQLTHLPKGVDGGLRWHPNSNTVFCVSEGAVVATCAKPGDPRFGKPVFLTPRGGENAEFGPPIDIVVSPDGTLLAYTRVVPTKNEAGKIVKNYAGKDFPQIFVLPFADADGDGIADE
ncbi:MAG: DUF3748 domain-containing protein [Candidatus Hydrogenedentes bacterium]|nr:DUF3748 domain-containing protein [Candidatus Hydrogenedentota bacterium]